jgi:hypothetical protein
MTELFLIIGAIALIITLFLILKVLIEIKNDKKAANQPDLYPVKATFTMTEFTFADNRLPFVLPVRVKQKVKDKNTSPTYLELTNIGMGAAKQIEIEWIFETGKIEALIQGIYDSNKKNFTNKEEVDFISAKDTIEIGSPIYYLNMFGPKVKSSIDQESSAIEKPSIELKISYKDIYNTVFSKRFITNIESIGSKVSLGFQEKK